MMETFDDVSRAMDMADGIAFVTTDLLALQYGHDIEYYDSSRQRLSMGVFGLYNPDYGSWILEAIGAAYDVYAKCGGVYTETEFSDTVEGYLFPDSAD